MQKSELQSLITALQEGIVYVTFTKIDSGEVRRMESTLKPEILKEAGIVATVGKISPESDHVAVWCLDKTAWRSFRVETVTGLEVA
jgi:hypothetical protein